jgi:hypothetical protein
VEKFFARAIYFVARHEPEERFLATLGMTARRANEKEEKE